MADPRVYRVAFQSQGKVYEIYAHGVSHSTMMGFVEVEEPVIGRGSSTVLDPNEESLRNEFQGVKRFFVPIHSVLRIDEVEREGSGKVSKATEGSVTPFPVGLFKPSAGDRP